MVVFACNSCGAALKKNQVDKHVFQCRCNSISCMDCQKDFGIKDYAAHTKCISEVEKYSATGWKAPANFNKGEKKQQAWVDTVNEVLKTTGSNLAPPCKSLLQNIAKHDNVPRKKAKFLNFISNVAKNRFDSRTIETVWNLLEQQWKSQADAQKNIDPDNSKDKENGESGKSNGNITNGNNAGDEEPQGDERKLSKREKKDARKQKQHKEEKKEKRNKTSVSDDLQENGDDEETKELCTNGIDAGSPVKESKKERKKRKRLESATELEKKKIKGTINDYSRQEEVLSQEGDEIRGPEEEILNEDEPSNVKDFSWGATIREVLLKQADHELSMKKLRKKVISEYYAVVGDSKGSKSQEELISKLNKKLRKQGFKVLKDSVRLVE